MAEYIEQHPHLQGLELADFSNSESSLSVDVLIGSDYYWEFVTGSICRGLIGLLQYTLNWAVCYPVISTYSEPNQCAVNLSVTHVLHSGTASEDPCALDDQL